MSDVPLTLGFRTTPGLSYQILTSHNCNSVSCLSSKLLLALASTVILGFESRGTHDHILLPRVSESCVTLLNSLSLSLNSNSKSKLLYDWRFTANHFVSAPSPLRLTNRDSFFFFATELFM
jgi:hypothetical protein